MTESCRLVTTEQLKEYKKAVEDRETLKKKLIVSKPELRQWVELNFGKVKE